MADLPPSRRAGNEADDSREGPDADATEGTPRWVIVPGIVVLVLVVLFVILHLAGGGFRGHMHQ